MGVQVQLRDILAGFLSATTHTANNTLVETGMNKALDRTGTIDNSMEVDIDMSDNSILNVSIVEAETLQLAGNLVAPTDLVVTTLPVQTGHSGKHLETNGTAAFWGLTDNKKEQVKNFSTLALAVSDTTVSEGDSLNIAQRTAGNGGGAMWDVVLSATVTENTFNIVQSVGVGTLSLVLRTGGTPDAIQAGAVGDGVANDTSVLVSMLTQFGIVRIPASKDCLIASNLEIPSDNCTIVGDGINSGSKISFSGDNRRIHAPFDNFTMRDLEVDGNKPNVGYETVNNTDYGVNIGDSVASVITGFLFDGVRFKDIGLDGIRLQNCSNVRIEDNCEFINCRRWGVVIIPDAFSQDDIYIGGHYDSSNGSGPSGKEFPLGAVDTEPNGGHPTVNLTNVRYGRVYSNRGEVAILDVANDTLDVTMHGVHVEDSFLRITNNKFSLADVTISGDEGVLRIDNLDSLATELRDIDVRFINSGRDEKFLAGAEKRANWFRADYGDSSSFGVSASVGGTGSVGQVATNVDGHDVSLTKMSLAVGAGNAVLTQSSTANISAGDQVFMYLEVDRTDGNTSGTPFFNMRVGAAGEIFTVQKLIEQGITKMAFAINAPVNIVTPAISFGLTATADVAIDVVVRKCFLFVNPEKIDNSRIIIKPFSKIDKYTGTGTGFVSNPSGDVFYTRANNVVTLTIPSGVFSSTSNSTSFTITGMPLEIRPKGSRVGFGRGIDNGAGLTNPITLEVSTGGEIRINADSSGGSWTASGTKGVSNTTFSYNIESSQ